MHRSSGIVCSSIVGVVSSAVLALVLSGCGNLERISPPGDYDRPAVVRGFARAGTYVGATVGIVASVALWPFTKTMNLLVDGDPLGYSEREWTFLPLTTFAAAGHYILGLPFEGLHFVFYGAWVDRPTPVGFDHVPQRPAGSEQRD